MLRQKPKGFVDLRQRFRETIFRNQRIINIDEMDYETQTIRFRDQD